MTTTTPTPAQIRTGWDRIAAGFDENLTPATTEVAEHALSKVGLTAEMRVLDVAAGSGALTIPAARRAAQVVATDISPTMIERLRQRARAEGLDNVEAQVMDGHDLTFDDDTFDLAVSQHGVSLFPDIDKGLRELARVTRPGGRVLVIAFGPLPKAEFLTFFFAALKAAMPGFEGPPMDPPPLPFQVADPELLQRKLADAGFSTPRVERAVWNLPVRSADHLWDVVLSSNPLGATFVAGLTDDQMSEARRVLDGMLRERSGGRPGAVLHVDINIATATA